MHCRNVFSTFQDVNSWIVEQVSSIVPEEAPLFVLDGKSDMCMDKNGNPYFIKVVQFTMAHMFQDQLLNKVQKESTMQHALQEWL